jgi:hypothetical protein
MKRIFILLIFSTLYFSCGTPKTVIQSKKVMKGEWVLNSVTINEKGNFAITLFNDASKECFEGSVWRFIPNNNSGLYSIKDENCVSGDRYFVFTIQEINEENQYYDFLLKPTNEKLKSEDNKGFRINLTQLTETDMEWRQTVMLDKLPFTITMSFTKITD